MHRTFPYLGLFAATLLLQIFLFDNLSIDPRFNPLVYVALIALLPLDTPPISMLLAGLAVGAAMDGVMGAAGINTIATLLIAFLRPTILSMVCDRENLREGGVPSPERFGSQRFIGYLLLLTFVHHAVFFPLESLSWAHFPFVLQRIVVSTIGSVLFTWIIARIFTAKRPARA